MIRQTGTPGDTDVLEKGSIYFIYAPGRGRGPARGVPDIHRFHMVLRPGDAGLFRLAVIGRKRLPDAADPERNWGFIQAVCASTEDVEAVLHDPPPPGGHACRSAGQGAYAFLQMGRALRLVYALDLPQQPGPLQAALNIAPQASMVMSISPPAVAPAVTASTAAAEPSLPDEDRRPAPPNPEFLDFQGAEFVLLGADERAPLDPPGTSAATAGEAADVDRIIRQLRFARARHPIQPLVPGAWEE